MAPSAHSPSISLTSSTRTERSHSGLVRTLGKRVNLKGFRGFESPPLRHEPERRRPSSRAGFALRAHASFGTWRAEDVLGHVMYPSRRRVVHGYSTKTPTIRRPPAPFSKRNYFLPCGSAHTSHGDMHALSDLMKARTDTTNERMASDPAGAPKTNPWDVTCAM